MNISERQKIKRQIYEEQAKFPADKEKIAELNRLLRKHPPIIEDEKRYNFTNRLYERKSI